MKKRILALTIALALVGCGSSSDDNSSGSTVPPGPDDNSGTQTELEVKMKAVPLQDIGTATYCDNSSPTFTTPDLNVAYHKDAGRTNIEDLKNAARLSQVALDELISKTGLDKSASEINITSNNKWTVCFNDNKTGHGEGHVRKLDFSPKNFSGDGYILAKHEFFHVIQSALVNNEAVYMHLPYWFQEASAEHFAGRNSDAVNSTLLNKFINETTITPLNILTWNKEQEIKTSTNGAYNSDLYKMYQKSLNYFISRGLTDTQIIKLTRDSYRNGQNSSSRPAFHEAMAALNLPSPLPVSFVDLRDNTADYQQHIITDWIGDDEYSANFATVRDGVNIGKLIMMGTNTDVEHAAIVSLDQTSYTYTKGILPDGNYDIYAINTADTAVYGPIQQTVTNGELGSVDFSGQALCTDCND